MGKEIKQKQTYPEPVTQQRSCRLARRRLFGSPPSERPADFRISGLFLWGGIPLEAGWIRRHMATCPRCQQRFSALAKVHLGLSLLKSQAHSLDLLSRANAGTVAVLHRDLRKTPKAQHLAQTLPQPTLRERIRLYQQTFSQIAACFALLILSKMGVFSSLEQTQKQGRIAMKHYYSVHLDDEMADDLFTSQV